jgi:hypothetical protein
MAKPLALALCVVMALASCGGGSDSDDQSAASSPDSSGSEPKAELLPSGGQVPEPRITALDKAARAAGCTLKSTRAVTRGHIANINERVHYDTNPPTTGNHFQVPAEDGIYEEAPPDTTLVHSMEHGRVVIWFKPSLPENARAGLRALVEQDDYQMILVPRSQMPFAVAATAWNARPGPQGAGRLLGCASFGPAVYDALAAFREQNRGRGPETVP